MRLNLGCGHRIFDGYVNVDKFHSPGVDVVKDLESLPWPWETDSVDEVCLIHVLEHLGQTPETYFSIIKELYRVCKDGALVYVEVPYPLHPDFWGDPTHVRPITVGGLLLLSKSFCNLMRAEGLAGTPIAEHIDVDFEHVENAEYTDPLTGILQASRITMRVKK